MISSRYSYVRVILNHTLSAFPGSINLYFFLQIAQNVDIYLLESSNWLIIIIMEIFIDISDTKTEKVKLSIVLVSISLLLMFQYWVVQLM